MEQCLPKKLKGSDGLPVPVGDDAPKSSAGGAVLNVSQSVEHDNALKDGRNGNTSAERAKRNDGAESEQIIDIDVEVNSLIKGKANETSTSVSQSTVAPVNFTSYVEAQYENAGNSSACVVSAGVGLLCDVLALDERQLKRERRKQANRESARKSRLRKQAEYEDLVNRWDSLKMENTALKSELEQLNANSEKLRRENAALMEKLEASGVAQKGEMVSNNVGADSTLTNNIEKVQEKSDTLSGKVHPDHNNTHENTKSETKLHQLLDSSSRTDTVAAR